MASDDAPFDRVSHRLHGVEGGAQARKCPRKWAWLDIFPAVDEERDGAGLELCGGGGGLVRKVRRAPTAYKYVTPLVEVINKSACTTACFQASCEGLLAQIVKIGAAV